MEQTAIITLLITAIGVILAAKLSCEGLYFTAAQWKTNRFLLNARPFVAVTKAQLFDMNGCELYQAPFVNVHRDHIEVISPVEDSTDFSKINRV